jgi:hypothetical protein
LSDPRVSTTPGERLWIREPPQRLDVTRETLARDHGHAGTRGHGFPAEWFAFFDIRYVHLDGGQPGGLEGVVQGDAGVRVGTEIDDEGVDAPVGQRVDPVDQRALVGRLEEDGRETEASGLGADELLKVLERGPAVNFRLALAEPVEVGAVEDGDFHRGFSVSMNSQALSGGARIA